MTAIKPFTPAHFLAAVHSNSVHNYAPKTSCCPDAWVGDVEWSKEDCGFHFVESEFNYGRPLNSSRSSPRNQRLIIVLESPHKDEFEETSDRAIGPAAGATGRTIRAYLQNVTVAFKPFVSGGTECRRYALILMNAVPYQCSLGQELNVRSNLKIRDDIFRRSWASGADAYFQARLSSYLTKNSLVMNACTRGITKGGAGGNWLRNLVERKILQTLQESRIPDQHHIRRLHPGRPTNWNSEKSW